MLSRRQATTLGVRLASRRICDRHWCASVSGGTTCPSSANSVSLPFVRRDTAAASFVIGIGITLDRFLGMELVRGSIPLRSTRYPQRRPFRGPLVDPGREGQPPTVDLVAPQPQAQ